jgi:Protein of unknown function, DUF547
MARPSLIFSRTAAAAAVMAVVLMPAAEAAANSIEDAFARHTAGSKITVDHSAWDAMLKAYVVKDPSGPNGLNRIAYAKWKSEGYAALKAYVAALEAVDVPALAKPEQFAFWANLYNAKTIDIVLGKYPVKSIKDIGLGGGLKSLVAGGPWQAQVTRAGGIALSLDDIEHKILRGLFKDPRVHYAVNCASVGCPNLHAEAFTGAKLEPQLEAAAKAFINSPRGFKLDKGKVTASSIYNWFQADFGKSEGGVLAHAMMYAEPDLKMKLNGVTGIAGYDYDWSLNDAR